MEIMMPFAVGALVAAGLYLMMQRHALSIFVGLVILAHAVNLLLFTVGGFTRGNPPILGRDVDPASTADPLPQALILTAIVIGLGVQSFLLVLLYRLVHVVRTADLDVARHTESAKPKRQEPT